MNFTPADKFRCVQRELELRKAVYPKWVGAGRMDAAKAEREILCMEAIVADYRKYLYDAQMDMFK